MITATTRLALCDARAQPPYLYAPRGRSGSTKTCWLQLPNMSAKVDTAKGSSTAHSVATGLNCHRAATAAQ